jgi:3-dehydrosphinganine reductase
LARDGWDLTLLARNLERLATAKGALMAHGVSIATRSVDVADAAGVEQAVAAAIAALGPPAVVVACAGIVVPGRLETQPLDAFHRTMAVNYFGALHLIRAVLPTMRAHRGGRIVLVASGAALIGLYGFSSYAPSKFAVRQGRHRPGIRRHNPGLVGPARGSCVCGPGTTIRTRGTPTRGP